MSECIIKERGLGKREKLCRLEVMDSSFMTAVGALLGGSGVKLVDYFIKRPDKNFRTAERLRDELRHELIAVRADIKQIADELDEWKVKYYNLLEENVNLKQRCKHLELELEVLKIKFQCHLVGQPQLPQS